MAHPLQPIEEDSYGVLRFKENKIVRFLLDAGPFDLNQIALMQFDNEDRMQLAQLIGYSLDGFAELDYGTTLPKETLMNEQQMKLHLEVVESKLAEIEESSTCSQTTKKLIIAIEALKNIVSALIERR